MNSTADNDSSPERIDKVLTTFPLTSGVADAIIKTDGAMKPRQHWIGPNTNMKPTTNIFLVTNSSEDSIVAFSNIGTALEFVRDSHGDLNAEGSALMLETATGLVPATNKAVKDRNFTGRTLHFTATDAIGANLVAAAQSKLDGALQACALVGVDPSNVATVANLRARIIELQDNLDVSNSDEVVTFALSVLPLNKRKHNKRS